MERVLKCGPAYRNIFMLLIAMCVACLVFQYRFSYASISQCFRTQPSGYVATRVVERVYFEVPTSPMPGPSTPVSSTNNEITTDSAAVSTEQPMCEPQKNVVFLKTHKTGSSTITNILNRFADWNNLTMLLPKDEAYYSFNWPNKFRLSYARDNHGKRPNILANHARYSQKSMAELFPRDKTTYVTILREPVKQWESTFSYMSFPYILNIHKKSDALDFFLKNPPSFTNIKKNAMRFPSLYLIKNPLFFDLGLDYKYFENATMIKRAVKALDNDFNLVLMMEHFDESMVLMKRRLCWSTDDIVFFKTNERLNKNKRRVLTEVQQDGIRLWNSADVALYDYFVHKFWKEIEKEGPGFYDDLEELRARKKYHYKQCIEKEAVTEAYTSVFVKGYEMRKNLTGDVKLFCERMLRNELSYQDYFKDRYVERVNKLEGETIENFENQLEEAEVEVEINENWGEDGHSYDYGLPTKRPRPPPSKVTILKTRVQKKKEKAVADALKAKKKRDAARKRPSINAKGKIVNEKEGSGEAKASRKKVAQDSAENKVNTTFEKPIVIDIEKETFGLMPIPSSNKKNKDKTKLNSQMHSKKSGKDSKEIASVSSGEEKSETQTVFKPELIDENDSKKAKKIPTNRPKKSKDNSIIANRPLLKTAESTPLTPAPTTAINPVTLEDRLTTLAKHIIELDKSPGPPEMTSEPYIKYADTSKNGSPMVSANKKLKIDDARRYDGKTIVTSRNKSKDAQGSLKFATADLCVLMETVLLQGSQES